MLTARRPCHALAAPFACLFASLLFSAAAAAAPVTVNLRVEGSAKTLFEGPIATSAEAIATPSSSGPHPCNYSENGPAKGFENGGNPSGTPTTALHDAALASGLAFDAEWFGSGVSNGNPGDFLVTQVGSDSNEKSAPFDSWGYAVSHTTANVGGCQIALAPGNEVVWAYNYFNLTHQLALSGPSSANLGTPVAVHVVDGQTGQPIDGAAIGEVLAGVTSPIPSRAVTDSSGNATITLAHAGTVMLKATRADSVRSNGLSVCVHNGNDGSCGTTPPVQACPANSGTNVGNACELTHTLIPLPLDVAEIAGIQNGHVYARRSAPRVLRGAVQVPAGGGLLQVRIRLERRNGRRCFNFSGARARFVGTRRCGSALFFSVGSAQSFSYLLPARLPAGRYAFDIEAVGTNRSVSKLVNGVSHVIFRVR
jgi:hypothetical protein